MKIGVKNLNKSYRDADKDLTVIRSLTADFPEGKTIALLGASGTGKSTLLHILGGLDRPSAGSVNYDDLDLTSLDPDELADFRAKHIGFIFQFHHLLPEFDALENVCMPLFVAGWNKSKAFERGREILSCVGLDARFHHRPSQLSGGEQQRVAVARALINAPTVVIADEPTGNLDPKNAEEVQQLMHSLNNSAGSTLIVATHSYDLARSMDIVYEMTSGGELSIWEEKNG